MTIDRGIPAAAYERAEQNGYTIVAPHRASGFKVWAWAGETDGGYDGLVWPDYESAAAYGRDLYRRWMGCTAISVVPVREEPNRRPWCPVCKGSPHRAGQCTECDRSGWLARSEGKWGHGGV